MSIEFRTGNIFKSGAQALVNPTNCVGVMGAGLALRFREMFPENFQEYRKVCKDKELVLGGLFITHYIEEDLYIINFPTKDHWRERSNIKGIERGLKTLRLEVMNTNIKSIAIPALGCGLGGLLWDRVHPLITKELENLDIEIYIYKPL